MSDFVFISYSHADKQRVLPIIEYMQKNGINVWYDKGIEAGQNWADCIGEKIVNCSKFLLFISKNYVASKNCREEFDFAHDCDRELLPVFLDEAELPLGMRMHLKPYQSIFYNKFPSEKEFIEGLCKERFFDPCRGGALIDSNVSTDAVTEGFDFDEYLKNADDPDYIKAQKEFLQLNYTEAFALYERAYNNGNLLAGVKLGEMYHFGLGTEKASVKAYQIFNKIISKNNDPLARAWIAHFYSKEIAVLKDVAKSKQMMNSCFMDLEQMCAFGDVQAQYFLGVEYFLKKDYNKAFVLLKRSYDSGYKRPGSLLAQCYINGYGCLVNAEKGVQILAECVEAEFPSAYLELGKLYYYGKGVEQDYNRAFPLLMYAAEKGSVQAQSYIGDCYLYRRGTERSQEEGIKWHLKAYESGSAYSAEQLGMLCYSTERSKAFRYIKYAADNGYKKSQCFLAEGFYFRACEYKDYKKGYEYLSRSAKSGFDRATYLLAEFHFWGLFGLKRDLEKWWSYLKKSAESGNSIAKDYIDTVNKTCGMFCSLEKKAEALIVSESKSYFCGNDLVTIKYDCYSHIVQRRQQDIRTALKKVADTIVFYKPKNIQELNSCIIDGSDTVSAWEYINRIALDDKIYIRVNSFEVNTFA